MAPVRSGVSRSTSFSRSRHRRRTPSAVRRARVQDAQNGAVTEEMKPMSPCAPGMWKRRASPSSLPSLDFQRAELAFDALLDLRGSDHLAGLHVGHAGEGHHLDEAHLPGTVDGQRGEVDHILLVVALDHHRVELDRAQARPVPPPGCRPRHPPACPSG